MTNNPVFSPKVSIITVTYNAAERLAKTIDSVISQSYKNIEFIIIDGASTDSTTEIIQKKIGSIDYWVSEPDHGIYDAMNKGLAVATGEYVQFLNAGDYFLDNDSLKTLVESAKQPYDVIYGDIMLVNADGGGIRNHKAMAFNIDNLKLFGTGVICHQAMLVNRDIAPMYDTKFRYKGELCWYFDICLNKNGDLRCFHYQKPLVYYFLGGLGYQNFIRNRFEWYKLLYLRFGGKSVINKKFLKFIYNDFKNRYKMLRF